MIIDIKDVYIRWIDIYWHRTTHVHLHSKRLISFFFYDTPACISPCDRHLEYLNAIDEDDTADAAEQLEKVDIVAITGTIPDTK